MDGRKKRHRPERLKGYDYSSPGYYFVTFNTRSRKEDILCSIVPGAALTGHMSIREAVIPDRTVEPDRIVGPAPLGGAFPRQRADESAQTAPSCNLTPAGKIIQELIENIDQVYCNAKVDCYVIMPDHVHLILWLGPKKNAPPRGAGPTGKFSALPQIINALKGLTSKKIGDTIWQDDYYDHIIRSDTELKEIRQYIQNNPLKWILDKD